MSAVRRFDLEELPPQVAARLAPRVARLGYLGEFFRCAAHQPDALAAFIDFTETAKGGMPDRLVELLALTVAGWMGNAYERNQHERLSIRLGFGRDWVAAANALDPETPSALCERERHLQRLALAILNNKGKGTGVAFGHAVEVLGEAQAIAVLMVIGRYVTHALIVNTLALEPPVPSIFEDGFVG